MLRFLAIEKTLKTIPDMLKEEILQSEAAELLEKFPLVVAGYIRFELTGLLP